MKRGKIKQNIGVVPAPMKQQRQGKNCISISVVSMREAMFWSPSCFFMQISLSAEIAACFVQNRKIEELVF